MGWFRTNWAQARNIGSVRSALLYIGNYFTFEFLSRFIDVESTMFLHDVKTGDERHENEVSMTDILSIPKRPVSRYFIAKLFETCIEAIASR